MIRTIAPVRAKAKVCFLVGLLCSVGLLVGCRSHQAERSQKPSTEKEEAKQGTSNAAPTTTEPTKAKTESEEARSETIKQAQEFRMIGVLEEPVAPRPSAAPRPSSRPENVRPLAAAPTGLDRLGVSSGSVGGYGKGIAQGFGAGSGRLGGSHRAAPQVRMNVESYAYQAENEFVSVKDEPLSTFAADVDTASYSNLRRFLNEGRLPPPSAVRIEELLNYFDYEYPTPQNGAPFGVYTEVTEAPWKKEHRLVHIGVKTAPLPQGEVPPRNLVFLLDVSGSMQRPDKLPLLKRSMDLLARNLQAKDKVSIVVYAGSSGVVLPPTRGDKRSQILGAIEELRAGGSTNGASGIVEAYRLAHQNFRKNGINRVLLATDGDFNVGTTSQGELVRLIEKERENGVFLTVLGFGRGNLKDSTMEMLADKGNGNYAYIDSLNEARKVLVNEGGATLVTVAKDVKFQVEFNPAVVQSYRLVGYENRKLAAQDFNDDTKDAGEMGAGHTVTVLYEIVPVGSPGPATSIDPLKYQNERKSTASVDELATVKLRYKTPAGKTSTKLEYPVHNITKPLSTADSEHQFATAVAEFGLVLNASENAGHASLRAARERAVRSLGSSPDKTRQEFVQLVSAAEKMLPASSKRGPQP